MFLLAATGGTASLAGGPATAAVSAAGASGTIVYTGCTARWKACASYYSAPGSRSAIYSIRSDGSRRRRLILNASNPSWSPSGRRIAYAGRGGIWVARADGKLRRRLTIASRRGFDLDPSWSPDGRKIVFMRDRGRRSDLYTVEVRTRRQKRLTETPKMWEFSPAWSPDGKTIAYERSNGIFVLDLVTRQSTKLTSGDFTQWAPDWSPDGTKIAVVTTDPWALVVMNRDGSGRRTIASHAVGFAPVSDEGSPSWSPDGRHIAYDVPTRSRSRQPRILIAPVEGQGRIRLLVRGGVEPDWR